MDTLTLMQELAKKPQNEIEFVLTTLMLDGKIDFISVNKSYIAHLETIREDQDNKLVEAETCVLQSFINKKGNKNSADNKHTQRCLYLLNQSNRFNMVELNKKYNYDEALGKRMSWYEKNKEEC